MTGMLASVTSVAEAEVVLQAGADIIDIKHPGLGALGAQDIKVIRGIVEHVNGRRIISATVGDILPDDPSLPDRIEDVAATGVDIVKVGLFASQPTGSFLKHIESAVKKNIKVVIVMFAENSPLDDATTQLLKTGVYGVMVDTCIKDGLSLRAHMSPQDIDRFVHTVQSQTRIAGLAGSLSIDDIQPLLTAAADYLGFRGALCEHKQRTAQIDVKRVESVCQTVHNGADIGYGEKYLQKAI